MATNPNPAAQAMYDLRDRFIVHPLQAFQNFTDHPVDTLLNATGLHRPQLPTQITPPGNDGLAIAQKAFEQRATQDANKQAADEAAHQGALRAQMRKQR